MARRQINGLAEVARASQSVQGERYKWLPIYFNFKTWTVSTDPNEGDFLVTELIKPNTEAEIEEAIHRWMMM